MILWRPEIVGNEYSNSYGFWKKIYGKIAENENNDFLLQKTDLKLLNHSGKWFRGNKTYQYLNTSSITKVPDLEKPDFILNPQKYFMPMVVPGEETNTCPELPSMTENLKLRHDEKTIFPKHILEKEAKLKASHRFLVGLNRGKRGTSFSRISSQGDLSKRSDSRSNNPTSLWTRKVTDKLRRMSTLNAGSMENGSSKND